MRRYAWFLGFLAIVALLIFLAWLMPSTDTTATPAPTNNTTTAAQTQPRPSVQQALATAAQMRQFKDGLENLPASLQGTQVDGEIIIDEQRNLLPTRRLRSLFDYFLSLMGEEDLPTVAARVHAYVGARVPEPAKNQTIQLFNQYLAYLESLKGISEAGGKPIEQLDLNLIAQQKREQQQLQKRFFNAQTISAFFADEQAFDDYSLKSMQISQNNQLSESEKARQLAELSAQLPQNMQNDMKPVLQYQQLEQLTEQLKTRGGSAAELHELRVNLVGAEAAQRLDQIDQEDAAFSTRVNNYLQQRARILAQNNLSSAQQQQQIDALQQQNFDERERLRLSAFEQLAEQRPRAEATPR